MPEACLDAQQADATLCHALRSAVKAGLPTHPEFGGLMPKARSVTWQGRSLPMVGATRGDAVMHTRPMGHGHVQLQATDVTPRLPAGSTVRGHEFHNAGLDRLAPGAAMAYRVQRGHGVSDGHDGVRVHNLRASQSWGAQRGSNHHLHDMFPSGGPQEQGNRLAGLLRTMGAQCRGLQS